MAVPNLPALRGPAGPPAVPSPNLQILEDALGPSIINSATQMQGTDSIQFKSEVRKEN